MSRCCCYPRKKGGLVIYSNLSGQKLKLSAHDKQIILNTWNNVLSTDFVGRQIFKQIFKEKPSLKDVFNLAHVPDDELEENVQFRRHSSTFMTFFDMCVKSLTLDSSYLVSLCRNVGKRHVSFRHVSFEANNWLIFKGAMLKAIVGYSNDRKRSQVWGKLISFMIREIKDAFYAETTKRHSITDFLEVGVQDENSSRSSRSSQRSIGCLGELEHRSLPNLLLSDPEEPSLSSLSLYDNAVSSVNRLQ